jgi:hypothetical protein
VNEHVLVWLRKRPTGEVASIDKSLLLPSPSNIALRCDLNLSFLSLYLFSSRFLLRQLLCHQIRA